MKVLFFSDVHANKDHLKKVLEKSKEADLLVCAGDLSKMGSGFGEMIEQLGELDKKVLLIPGNNETKEFVRESEEHYDNTIMIEDNLGGR